MAVRKHLALALLLALGLSACASSEPPQAETPPTRQTQPEAPEPTLEEQQQAAAEEYTEKLTLEQQSFTKMELSAANVSILCTS